DSRRPGRGRRVPGRGGDLVWPDVRGAGHLEHAAPGPVHWAVRRRAEAENDGAGRARRERGAGAGAGYGKVVRVAVNVCGLDPHGRCTDIGHGDAARVAGRADPLIAEVEAGQTEGDAGPGAGRV